MGSRGLNSHRPSCWQSGETRLSWMIISLGGGRGDVEQLALSPALLTVHRGDVKQSTSLIGKKSKEFPEGSGTLLWSDRLTFVRTTKSID